MHQGTTFSHLLGNPADLPVGMLEDSDELVDIVETLNAKDKGESAIR